MSGTRMHSPAEPPGAAERGAFDFKADKDDGVPGLVRRLAEQGSHLAEQQLKLIETEIRSGIADLKESAGAMAGAAVLGLAGLGVLLMGFAYLLAEAMPLWLATMIVAAIALGGAWVMFSAGRKKLQSSALRAERSKETLRRAPTAISGHSEKVDRHAR
jgi:hypothetical protein